MACLKKCCPYLMPAFIEGPTNRSTEDKEDKGRDKRDKGRSCRTCINHLLLELANIKIVLPFFNQLLKSP